MTAWLLSIVGVVFLSVMIDVVAPSGKMNGIIKTMFAIILIYVVMTPVIKLLKSGNVSDFVMLGNTLGKGV